MITHPHKFLCSHAHPVTTFHTTDKLKEKLVNVDNAKCRSEFKLAVYDRYALPSLRYHLSVHTLHKTHLDSLGMLAKSFIKKWLGIPTRGVTAVAIFHPYKLNVKKPSALYLENHAGNHTIMRLKGDSVVKAIAVTAGISLTKEEGWPAVLG